jgi:hypothetical protein
MGRSGEPGLDRGDALMEFIGARADRGRPLHRPRSMHAELRAAPAEA